MEKETIKVTPEIHSYVVESATRIICLGNNWGSPSLDLKEWSTGDRDSQEEEIAELMATRAGRAQVKNAIQEVMTAYKDSKTVKFLTKKHIRNIIRIINLYDSEELTGKGMVK